MSQVREMAQKLLEAENGYAHVPYSPYGSGPPRLDDLWPVDQQRYERMAEAALARKE